MVLTSSLSRLETLRALSVAAIVTNVGIVLTGGIVRLTGSGLGCPDWPTCDGDRVLPAPGAEAGWHQAIEFGNRLLTFVVLAVAVAAWVSARAAAPDRPEVRRAALGLPLGVLAQAVLGGVTVLTELDPLVVAAHFLLSMVLLVIATVLYHRVSRLTGHAPEATHVDHRVAWLVGALVGLAALVLVLGTLVTASGPHAGDPGTHRLGLDIRAVARVHAGAVWLTVATTVAVLVAARRGLAGAPIGRAARTVLGLEVAQGAVGYLQYALGVPAGLVAVHLLLASLFWVAVVRLALSARADAGEPRPATPAATASAA
ncbi:MAG TPA: COX15/CtaA family protein [Nitriliruptorales bacterium]